MAAAAPDTQGYENRSVAFRGFFDGTALRINVPPALSFEMTIAGRAMREAVQGQQTFGTVELVAEALRPRATHKTIDGHRPSRWGV